MFRIYGEKPLKINVEYLKKNFSEIYFRFLVFVVAIFFVKSGLLTRICEYSARNPIFIVSDRRREEAADPEAKGLPWIR